MFGIRTRASPAVKLPHFAERLNGIRGGRAFHAPHSPRSFTRDLFALVFTFATSGTIQVPMVPWPSLLQMESYIFVDAALLLEQNPARAA